MLTSIGVSAKAGSGVICKSDGTADSPFVVARDSLLGGCAPSLARRISNPRLAISLLGLIVRTFFKQARLSSSVSTAPLNHSQATSLCLSCFTTCASRRRASAFRPSLRAAIPCFKRSSVAIVYSVLLSLCRLIRLLGLRYSPRTATLRSWYSQYSSRR